jgi:hypothetical protein
MFIFSIGDTHCSLFLAAYKIESDMIAVTLFYMLVRLLIFYTNLDNKEKEK